MMGNPLMNDASLSQTAGRAKTRQPGLIVEPTQILLNHYHCSDTYLVNMTWMPAYTSMTSLLIHAY